MAGKFNPSSLFVSFCVALPMPSAGGATVCFFFLDSPLGTPPCVHSRHSLAFSNFTEASLTKSHQVSPCPLARMPHSMTRSSFSLFEHTTTTPTPPLPLTQLRRAAGGRGSGIVSSLWAEHPSELQLARAPQRLRRRTPDRASSQRVASSGSRHSR